MRRGCDNRRLAGVAGGARRRRAPAKGWPGVPAALRGRGVRGRAGRERGRVPRPRRVRPRRAAASDILGASG